MNKPTKEDFFDEVIICNISLTFWNDRYKRVCHFFDNTKRTEDNGGEMAESLKELRLCAFRLNYENKIILRMEEKYKKLL